MKTASAFSLPRPQRFVSGAIVVLASTVLIAPAAIAQSTVYTPISTFRGRVVPERVFLVLVSGGWFADQSHGDRPEQSCRHARHHGEL